MGGQDIQEKCSIIQEDRLMNESGWGGAREGAGRKPCEDKRVQMVITISRETKEKMKALCQEKGVNAGRLVDILISEF